MHIIEIIEEFVRQTMTLPIGQGSSLQTCVSWSSSPQSVPLNCGIGLVQLLTRV